VVEEIETLVVVVFSDGRVMVRLDELLLPFFDELLPLDELLLLVEGGVKEIPEITMPVPLVEVTFPLVKPRLANPEGTFPPVREANDPPPGGRKPPEPPPDRKPPPPPGNPPALPPKALAPPPAPGLQEPVELGWETETERASSVLPERVPVTVTQSPAAMLLALTVALWPNVVDDVQFTVTSPLVGFWTCADVPVIEATDPEAMPARLGVVAAPAPPVAAMIAAAAPSRLPMTASRA
jgi:hypothetical protein